MKIVSVDVHSENSSTGRIVSALHDGYLNHKYDSYILYGRGRERKDERIIKCSYDIETYLHAFFSKLIGITVFQSFFSTLNFIKKIKLIKPDVIHIHEIHGYFINIIYFLKFLKKINIKIIWTFHCEYMYTGKGYIFEKTEHSEWSKKKEYPRNIIFDMSNYNVKRYRNLLSKINDLIIVSPSIWLKNRIENSFLSNRKVIVINNGIDTNKFIPNKNILILNKYNITKDKFIILTIAANIEDNPIKGIKHIKFLAENLNKDNVEFVVVGGRVTKKISENLLIIDKTYNFDDLSSLYSTVDLYLLPSIRENFPTTCLESISCGTPVVGIDSGGSKETALYPFGVFKKNVNDLLSLIKEIRLKKIIFPNYVDIRNFAIEQYSNTRMIENYIKVIEESYK